MGGSVLIVTSLVYRFLVGFGGCCCGPPCCGREPGRIGGGACWVGLCLNWPCRIDSGVCCRLETTERISETARKILPDTHEALVSSVAACLPPIRVSVPAPPPMDARPPPFPDWS